MFASFTFVGLVAPVFTIFNSDLTLNTEGVPKYANYLARHGIGGILVAGTSGEGPSLTIDERKEQTEAWADAVKDTSQHLMVQVGGTAFPNVIELAKHASNVGADSILCLPDLYFRPQSNQELINYLRLVSAAVPNLPLLYYHIPANTGVNISVADFLEEAADQLPNLVGVKYTDNDINGAIAAVRAALGKYTIFIADDTVMAEAFSNGFNSAIASSISAFPHFSTEILEGIRYNRFGMAYNLQRNLTNIVNILRAHGPLTSSMKTATNMFSPINVGYARPPLGNPNPYSIDELESEIKQYL
ncbi:hypothetical protein ABEB36_002259 [Hypothenemus hampei]|uniref:N-acetylneuraminate lyase n=1 Tax=Hypothenemus hampei TaxID=57062 RepID=A0ABD1F5R4_HYPHA